MTNDLPGQLVFNFDDDDDYDEQYEKNRCPESVTEQHQWVHYGTYKGYNFYRCKHCGKECEA